jgi:hypothetical protein
MTATNKWLLISESRGDSDWCTLCRGNPNQHAAYASHASPRAPDVRFLWAVPVCSNLSWIIDRVEHAHCSREEGLSTQFTARRWPIHGSVPTFSPEPANEAVGVKPSIYQRPANRFTGLISPVCDRYVHYLLAGAKWTVLNWHRWWVQPWRCRLATYPLPDLPNQLSPLSPSGPAGLQFNQVLQSVDFKEPMAVMWSFDNSAIYHTLHLRLAIANDLSLVVGSQG